MKAIRVVLIGMLGASLAGAGAADPGLTADQAPESLNPPWATVTMPYAELRALWALSEIQTRELQQIRDARPPMDAVLLASEYELLVRADPPLLEANYHVRTLTDDWHLVPLLGGDFRLQQVEVGQTSVVWHNDRYCLLAHGKGDHHFKLRFVLATDSEWTSLRRLRLLPGPSAQSSLHLAGAADGTAFRVLGLAAVTTADGSKLYCLPADSPELVLAMEPDVPVLPPVPSPWELDSEVLVGLQEGRLLYRVRAHAQADTGSGVSMELVLPANVIAAEASGEDLIDCRVGPAESGRRTLHLAWKTRDQLHRTFMLSYGMPQSPLSTNWSFHAPQLAGNRPSRAVYVILPVDGIGFTGQNLRDARHSFRLPLWIQEQVQTGDYLTAESGAELQLQAEWLPRVQTAQAMVSQAEYQSRIVEDGGLLVSAGFAVQHEAPLNWLVRLPTADQLLTCQVNGVPVQPIQRDPQEIEFALAAAGNQTTRVTFSYAARLPALDPVSGSFSVELPRTELFIHDLDWVLTLPELYETTALEGNVRIANPTRTGADSSRDADHVLRLKKELVQGESPRIEVHYQRRGLVEGQ
jgi:hypothetical protein